MCVCVCVCVCLDLFNSDLVRYRCYKKEKNLCVYIQCICRFACFSLDERIHGTYRPTLRVFPGKSQEINNIPCISGKLPENLHFCLIEVFPENCRDSPTMSRFFQKGVWVRTRTVHSTFKTSLARIICTDRCALTDRTALQGRTVLYAESRVGELRVRACAHWSGGSSIL